MKKINFLLIALIAFFAISFVSATITVSGGFNNNLHTKSLSITVGNNARFIGIMTSTNPPITPLFGIPSGVSVSSESCANVGSNTYYCNYTVTSSIVGVYKINIGGSDNSGSSDYDTLTLTVNPAPVTNSPPTISTIQNQQVNESSSYSYQVSASDSDGDILTYSLSGAPSWLSINPSTGLITGNSPSVSADANYTVQVGVSDGTNPTVTTSYTLTVKNVSPPVVSDTTAPIINLNFPADGHITNVSMNYFSATVSDNVAVRNVSILLNGITLNTSYSGINDSKYKFPLLLADGIYNWSYRACDTSGNCATSPNQRLIVDTIAPTLNFASSTTSGNVSQDFIYVDANAADSGSGIKNLDFTLYNSTGIVQVYSSLSSSISMNVTGLADGTYYLNATAMDNAGNLNSTATRTIILDTTAPTIDFVFPTPANNSELNQTYIPANITVSDLGTGVKNETIYLYNSNGLVTSSNSEFYNFTGLADGTYYLNATVYDNIGNFKGSTTLTIKLNNSVSPGPTLTPQPPQSNQPTYSYSDPYASQYQEQLNQTSQGITLGTSENSISSNAFWAWVLAFGILVILGLGVLIILGRIRLNKKQSVIEIPPEKAAVLY